MKNTFQLIARYLGVKLSNLVWEALNSSETRLKIITRLHWLFIERKRQTKKTMWCIGCDLVNSSDFGVSVSPERFIFLSSTRTRKWWSILCNARAGEGLKLKPSIFNLLKVIIPPLSTYLVPNVFVFLSPPTQRHSFLGPNYATPCRGWNPTGGSRREVSRTWEDRVQSVIQMSES